MPRVVFTPQLRRFTETPTVDSGATTLRAALEDANRTADTLRAEKAALEAENAQQRSRIIELELSVASPPHSGSSASV